MRPKDKRTELQEQEIARAAWLDVVTQINDASDEIQSVLEVDTNACEGVGTGRLSESQIKLNKLDRV